MEHSKRVLQKRLDQLIEVCNEKREALDELLSFPIEALKDDIDDIREFMSQLKESCTDFTNVCHDCICAFYKHGCITEATEIKKSREEKKASYKERISHIDALLNSLCFNEDASSVQNSLGSLRSAPAAMERTKNLTTLPCVGFLNKDTCSLNASTGRISHNINEVNTFQPSTLTSRNRSHSTASINSNVNYQNSIDSCSSSARMPNVNIQTNNSRCCSSSSNTNSQLSQNDLVSLSNLNLNSAPFSRLHRNYIDLCTFKNETSNFYHSSSNNNLMSHSSNMELKFSSNANPSDTCNSFSRKTNASSAFSHDKYQSHTLLNDPPPYSIGSSNKRTHEHFDGYPTSLPHDISLHQTPYCSAESSRRVTFTSPGTNQHDNVRFSHRKCNNPVESGRQFKQMSPQPTIIVQDSASNHMLKQQLFQKPASPYSGEPHRFSSWLNTLTSRMSGLNLSPWDRLLILEANTVKEPQKIVQKCMALGGSNPEKALDDTMSKLRSEFGSSIRVANALNQRLDSSPPIKSIYNIDKLKDLLEICEYIEANITTTAELNVFDSAYGAKKVWNKLPETMQNNWRSICEDYRFSHGDTYPHFSIFVNFLKKKTREFSDPLFQRPNFGDNKRGTTLKTSPAVSDSATLISPNESYNASKTLSTESAKTSDDDSNNKCPLHENSNHLLGSCRKFEKMLHKDKMQIIRNNKLCYTCLGHHLRINCSSNVKCAKCQGKHLTILHFDSKKQDKINTSYPPRNEATLCTNFNDNPLLSKSCSKTLLVEVFSKEIPSKRIRCYAILDEQSSSSFCDPKLAEAFEVHSPVVDYNLKTLSGSSTETQGVVLKGLRIRGVNEKKSFDLPTMYTNPFIPDCKSEVASPEVVRAHPHIRQFAERFNSVDGSAEVLLLLGRDTGSLMFTRCHGNRPPFAHRTALGWALVGVCYNSVSSSSKSTTVLKISLNEHFLQESSFRHSNKPFLSEDSIFTERRDDELPGLSNDDRKFLDIVARDIEVNASGNIVLPLPFHHEQPKLPDNHTQVYCRTKNSLSRLSKDKNKLPQCLAVMEKYISHGHVEVVPDHEIISKIPGCAWWIPVFPVTHPKNKKYELFSTAQLSTTGHL